MTSVEPTRVFLLDDHEVVRSTLAVLLERHEAITVVGQWGQAHDAVEVILAARPDVAVLDIQLSDGSGLEVCRELRAAEPSMACLMLTSVEDEALLKTAAEAGAVDFVLKTARAEQLIAAIGRAAHDRGRPADSPLANA